MFVRIAFRDARFFTGITLLNLYLRFCTLYFEFNYVFGYFNCVITQIRLLSIALAVAHTKCALSLANIDFLIQQGSSAPLEGL